MQLIVTDNKRVVIGLGQTGLSCARYLQAKQLPFSVVDSREAPPELSTFKTLFPDVPVALGGIDDEALTGATELIVSPGVALDEPAIAKAQANGATICGDIDLFVKEAKAPIVAITGSNGKSTVTTLLTEMALKAGKHVYMGGNIGIPVLDLLEKPAPDFYVLELSSFQLERAAPIAAEVATVLNISADHMDRYSGMPAYHQAKHRIFLGCRQVVVNASDRLTTPLVPESVKEWRFSLKTPEYKGFGLREESGKACLAFDREILMPVDEIKIIGKHNVSNALAALALGHAMGLPFAPMLETLKMFPGLEHRCRWVAEKAHIAFYNDSKGTNVGAAIAAIEGLSDRANRIVLIAGGVAKGADFSPLKPILQQHCHAVVLIGEATDTLKTLIKDDVVVACAESMDDAVRKAFQLAEPRDAVLLSPACASFDQFENYQQRGEAFAAAVLALDNGGAH